MIAADFFCGFGGFSQGGEAAGLTIRAGANHDATAMAVYKANYPDAEPLLGDIWVANLKDALAGDDLDVLLAAPDCRDFSLAKGGPIKSKRVRALPWSVVRAMKEVRPSIVFVENVPAFSGWGPLDAEGRRIPERVGETFRAWLSAIRRTGYVVEWRVLDSARYGARTRRKRFFAVARRDGRPIRWPLPTHDLPGLLPVRTAAECIDWSVPCRSIFGRPKDLAVATQRRIAEGYKRFVVEADEPFVPPILVEPRGGVHADLCAAWIVKHFGGVVGHDLRRPLGAITAKDHHSLAVAYLVKLRGTAKHGHDLREPLPTVTSGGTHLGLVQAWLISYYGTGVGQSLRAPMRTLTTHDRMGLVVARGELYQPFDFAMRMLRPHELLAAQFGRFAEGFDMSAAKTQAAQVRGIGGSVCPELAEALIRVNVMRAEAVA